MQSAIISNLKLYADKYDEEFQPFLGEFTQDSWNLLLKTGALVKYDDLVTNALKFLSTLVGKSMHKGEMCGSFLVEVCLTSMFSSVLRKRRPAEYLREDCHS